MNELKPRSLNLGKIFFSSLFLLFHPRILILLLVPFIGAVIIWILVGYGLWQLLQPNLIQLGMYLSSQAQGFADLTSWIPFEAASASVAIGLVVLILFSIPMVWLTAIFITSVVAMPVIVRLTHQNGYSHLHKKGSMNVRFWMQFMKLSLLFLVSWGFSLTLLLVPGIGFLGPLAVVSYFQYRINLVDAMSDYATEEEIGLIRSRYQTQAWLLGLISAAFMSVPVVNFLAPVASALLFSSFGFAALEAIREQRQS